MNADSGTIHILGNDGVLHLKAASDGIPQIVLDTIKDVPVGKGMAGLAVERKLPVNACNIQTDATGDVRPGARATGLQGSVVVPMLRGDEAVGALGVATRHERTFTDAEEKLLLEIGECWRGRLTDRIHGTRIARSRRAQRNWSSGVVPVSEWFCWRNAAVTSGTCITPNSRAPIAHHQKKSEKADASSKPRPRPAANRYPPATAGCSRSHAFDRRTAAP